MINCKILFFEIIHVFKRGSSRLLVTDVVGDSWRFNDSFNDLYKKSTVKVRKNKQLFVLESIEFTVWLLLYILTTFLFIYYSNKDFTIAVTSDLASTTILLYSVPYYCLSKISYELLNKNNK